MYVKTGIVRIGYQHFAFLGDESFWAAQASECAAEQGKFWTYHDYLYEHQNGENRGAFNKDNLKKFALALKLDANQFNACFDSNKYETIVTSEVLSAQSLGVRSTPSFLINQRPIAGALPFDMFRQLIEAERKK